MAFFMVERTEQGTNSPVVHDMIEFLPKVQLLSDAPFRELYLEKHLTSREIAAQLGCSKTFVLARLSQIGLRGKKGRMSFGENYRHSNPPYGYEVRNRRLVLSKKEQRVCSLIVQLREQRKLPFHHIAAELESLVTRNRRGTTAWHHYSVALIYRRWKGKV